MMKKACTLLIAVMFVFSMAGSLYAADLPAPVERLKDGMVEVVSSPAVLYHHTKAEIDDADQPVMGFFKGVLTAPFHMVYKMGHGLIDVVTFPVEPVE